MAVTKQIPIKIYPHADGTTKTFPFDFQLINVTDLDVRLGGQSQTSGYTVDIQNNQGGNVVFTTAPAKDIEVMLRRATPFQRDTDYQDNGDLLADTLDDDLDRIWLALQEQQAATDIVISRPVGGDSWDARNLQIGNLLAGVDNNDAATVGQVRTLNGDTVAASLDAANSKKESAASAAAALASQTAAKTSETNAAGSATAAATSAANLATAVTAAAGSATAAAGSAAAALASQNAAKASETSTAGVAAAALASQNAAAGSATAAAGSAKTASDAATATAGSVAAAAQSAREAAASATAAAGSATAADDSADESARTAGLSAASATAAADSATAAKASETKAAADAAKAATANPDNQLKKAQNLADLADTNTARANLLVQGVQCKTSTTAGDYNSFTSPNGAYSLRVAGDGGWRFVKNDDNSASPLSVGAGGTGATNASGARINLEVERYNQSASETYIQTPDRLKYFTINDAGDWGMWDTATQSHIPLGIQDGGTGATTWQGAREALGVVGVTNDDMTTSLKTKDGQYFLSIDNTGNWYAYSVAGNSSIPLAVKNGGTGAGNAKQARYNLNAATGSEAVRIPNGENVLAYVASQAQSGYYSCGDNATQLPSGNEGYWMFNFHCHGVNTQGIAEYGHLTAIGASSGRMWHCRLIALANWTGWQLIASADDPLAARSVLKATFQDDQPIADSESINNDRFFKPGFYYKQYDPAATIENGFPPGNRSGALHTVLNGANGAKGVTQLYYPYMGAGGAYFRQYDATKNTFIDGNTYSGWKEFLSNNGQIVASASQPITAANIIADMNDARLNHVGFSYNSATNSPGKSGTFVGFESAVVKGYGFQLIGSYDAPGNLYYRSRNGDSQTWYPWVKMYGTNNTTTDTNGNLKPSSPIVKLKGDGTAEFNEEAEGVMVERIDTGVYKVSGVLGFNSDPIWGGAAGGYVIPQNGNGLPLLWVDYDVEPNGDLVIRTYHREHLDVPAFARNHIEGLKDGEPVDIPAGRWVDLRVEMPEVTA